MTQKEFLRRLSEALARVKCESSEGVLKEYRAFFEQKKSDGYSEKEICARLRPVEEIVSPASGRIAAAKLPLRLGLIVCDFFAGLFFLMMAALGAAIFVIALALIRTAALLLVGQNPLAMFSHLNIEFKDYWSGALIGLSLIALAGLCANGGVYYFMSIKQMLKSYARFKRNALCLKSGKPLLPGVPLSIKLDRRLNRRGRYAVLTLLIAFQLCLILGFISAWRAAGQMDFWNAWEWIV